MSKEIIVMPPQAADVKALPLISDLQFLEICTSEALNRKMLGVVNDGIRRGFNYKIGNGLKMSLGDESGKNTACVERDGVLLTVQGQHAVEVTLPAGKESAIVIEGFYKYGVKTKQVDANSNIDGAKIIVVDSNKTLDHHVVLCDVNVPLGATQITEPMISIVRRKAAGLDIQSHVDHADPHVQYVKKTFQIKTALPLKGGKDLNGDNLTLSIDTATTARTGTVQLIDSYTSTSAVLAPTGNALRAANQRAIDKENSIQSDLNSHKSNKANPHSVTKSQVGLGSVPNYPATSAVNDASDAKFSTAGAVKKAYDKALAVETAVNGSVTAHINNKSNPHAVTKAQVGLGSVPNYAASDAYNSNGTNLATRTAVFNAYTALTNSINTKISTTDANNKFLDSATYLKSRSLTDANSATGKGVRFDYLIHNAPNRPSGLANSDCALLTCNYDASSYATQIATDWYASSMFVRSKTGGTWKEWAKVYTTLFKPTKADVGLSAVNNWGATTAVNSTSTTTYATASAVKQAYDKALAVETAVNGSVTAHINNRSNPHAVTKAQIGLGRVNDIGFNWSWGTANPTHIWGSQGDANESYVYNGTQLKAFIGLSAVNNWGATTAVNSTSTTTYATASAVKQAYDLAASKMTQATADGRYVNVTGDKITGKLDLTCSSGINWRPVTKSNMERGVNYYNADGDLLGSTGAQWTGSASELTNYYFGNGIGSPWSDSEAWLSIKKDGVIYAKGHRIYHAGFKPSKADVGLSAVNNWGATTAVNSTSTTTYATASAVKQAYDLAASKITKSQGDSYYLAKTAQANSSKANFGAYSTSGAVNSIAPATGGFQYHYNIIQNSTGCFPTSNNANGVLTFNTHSGEYYQQLGFSSDGKMYHRPNRTGGWGQIYTSLSKPSKADVGLSAVNNWGATTAVNSTSTTTYATASAVKQAYDLAASKMTQGTADGRYYTKGEVDGRAKLGGSDSTVRYGSQGLQVSNFAGVGGTGANGTQLKNPTSDWYHHITMNHPNSSGFYIDMSFSFNSDKFCIRRVVSGVDHGFCTLYHDKNKPTTADVTGLSDLINLSGTYNYVGGSRWLMSGSDNTGVMPHQSGTGNSSVSYLGNSGWWWKEVWGNSFRGGSVNVTGDITAFSDQRVKANIEVIPNALSKVCQIRGVTFTRTDLDHKRQTGLIAQELEKVLPEAVITSHHEALDIDDFKSVNYGATVGLLVEAIKDLKAEIEELKNGK